MLLGAAADSKELKASENGFAGRVRAAGHEVIEAVRKAESKSVTFGSEAYKGHSLARLERNYRVGELAVMERSGITDC